MEKTTLLPESRGPEQASSYAKWSSWFNEDITLPSRRTSILLMLIGVIVFFLDKYNDNSTGVNPAMPRVHFNWASLPASQRLEYQPCYRSGGYGDGFECARLSVPLDHFNQSTDANISIAVIRLRAPVPPTDPRYGGAVLFNPGGPGGSGVSFLLRSHRGLADAISGGLDRNDSMQYDLISFDPRGVGLSSPALSCFTSELSSWTWTLRIMEEGILGSSDASLGRLWSMAAAAAGSCSLPLEYGEIDIKKYVSTASVAADMVHIVERHGEWREAEAKHLMSVKHQSERRLMDIPESLKYRAGEEKINYWGFSYGTYLGATFASMYPQRVGRLILDGVVDAEDYTATLWQDNLVDTEEGMRLFYRYCAEAGYPACALANASGETTASDVETRVTNITNGLIHNPLPVIGSDPEVISYSDVKYLVFNALYSPIQSMPLVAKVLSDLELGDGEFFASLLAPSHQPVCSEESAVWYPDRNEALSGVPGSAATISIACSDGDSQSWLTRDGFGKYWRDLAELSPTVGPMWAMIRLHCAHYTVRPAHRFTGPWEAKTASPILLIGNSADPVTPVRNARKMARGFPGARVLQQESGGHCSVAARSKCTSAAVYRYFQSGELPEEGARCQADEAPFGAGIEVEKGVASVLSTRLQGGAAGKLMPMIF